MNEFRHRISGLSSKRRALLRKWISENTNPATHDIPRRTPPGEPCALSFAQQRLWFLAQLEPGSPLYNVPRAIEIHGALNRAALQQALSAVVSRHQTLRTTFDVAAGTPVQIIGGAATVELPVLDLRAISPLEREAEIQRLSGEEARRPFNLASDLMIRTLLLQVGDEDHVLLLTMHHIASDAWSSGILFREFASFYEDICDGKPSRLAELPIQYADYAVWQRQRFDGQLLASELAHWRKQLDHLAPVLELPADRPRPAAQSYRGARQHFRLSRSLSDGVKALSRSEGVTLYMTLLAAFQTLLHRYTGKDDIVVGSPIAGRDRMETEGLIGFFVNTLLLRTDLSGGPSFRGLLRRVRETALTAYAHQELPFEKLVEELQPGRNLSHHPLFQVSFVLQNTPTQAPTLAGLTLTPREIDSGTAKFDLTLAIGRENKEQELAGFLEYSTDLFDATTILRMTGHFENVVAAMITNPDERIGTCSLLTSAEMHQVLVEWNRTATDFPQNECLHELFEAQVAQTPEADAVVFEDQRLTYRELNRRANQLGSYLVRQGVGPDVLVGLCMERSLKMVIGILAVLKAGGAYVPLDPAYPAERLAFMVQDARMPLVLTQRRLANRLPASDTLRICLESDWSMFANEPAENLTGKVRAEGLAYVIYTSGSTGMPKGVMISHKGLVNYLSWATQAYKVEAGGAAPVHSSIGFDLTITSLFCPLLVGGRVVLLAEDQSVEALPAFLRRETDLSLIKITPAHLELLSHELHPAEIARCEGALVIGGEALRAEQLTFWRTHAPAVRLMNEYGPTETVVGCCVYEVPSGSCLTGSVPIGRPIANTQLYVLDRERQPVPIGVPGELYIGGAGLARGYLNRPELTAEIFGANPFSQEPGSRLYRSGDLVRYGVDGTIEFLGRIDRQVKLRGFRIELGEIELVLASHPAVQQTVVTLREDQPGNPRLVAYIVSDGEEAPSMGELKSFLGAKLPDYMIPSGFVFLEAVALTANGKIDRTALPPEAQAILVSGESYVSPRTPVEHVLARIWGEVLKLERVSIVDNFFDAGGHSLLATQVTSRIRSILQVDLPVRRLFEAPTVEKLSHVILAEENTPGQAEKIARIVMEVATMPAEETNRALERMRSQARLDLP